MTTNRNGSGLDAAVAAEVRAELGRRKDVSVAGIARAEGIRRATLSERINGRKPFSPSLLSAVAAHMDVTASELTARAEQSLRAHQAA